MISAYISYGYPRFYFDWTYILVLAGVVLSLWASAGVKSAFSRFSAVKTARGITGQAAAEQILRRAGINDVTVARVSGDLTDHYDPSKKVLRLSDSVFNATSVAAVSVAAHECGHAIQHHSGYIPLSLRTAIVPVANFGSAISWPLIIAGLFLGGAGNIFTKIGIILFAAVVAFHLITLPVEFNASFRAVRILSETGMLIGDENEGAKKVLKAAALTYVAGAATMILQLLRILLLTRGRSSRDD